MPHLLHIYYSRTEQARRNLAGNRKLRRIAARWHSFLFHCKLSRFLYRRRCMLRRTCFSGMNMKIHPGCMSIQEYRSRANRAGQTIFQSMTLCFVCRTDYYPRPATRTAHRRKLLCLRSPHIIQKLFFAQAQQVCTGMKELYSLLFLSNPKARAGTWML